MPADACRSRIAPRAPERCPVDVGRSCLAIILCHVWLGLRAEPFSKRCSKSLSPRRTNQFLWLEMVARADSWLRLRRDKAHLTLVYPSEG